jgi:hypothetical protein
MDGRDFPLIDNFSSAYRAGVNHLINEFNDQWAKKQSYLLLPSTDRLPIRIGA